MNRSLSRIAFPSAVTALFLTGVGCARVVPVAPDAGGTGAGSGTDGPASAMPPPAVVDAGGAGGTTSRPPPAPVDGGNCQRELQAVVRDFRSGVKDGQPVHPDFEGKVAVDPGIVARMLGADGKPVYAGGTQGTTTGKDNFDQWYRDVPGVNITFEKTIPLSPDPTRPGVWVYDNDMFYPLANDEGFGDQYLGHNQDFTTEIHLTFPYKGGESFTFRGDDDVFLFVNGILALDLGGVHSALSGTIDMDARASELGLELGKTYRMDIFQADRHCCQSTFHIETTLSCIINIVIN